MRRRPDGSGDVKRWNTVIASPYIVAADARAAKLFGLAGEDIGYLVAAEQMGLGKLTVPKRRVKAVAIA